MEHAEKFDDDEAEPDDRQRTAGRNASPGSETLSVGNSTVAVVCAPT
jgi:hypothetical protein